MNLFGSDSEEEKSQEKAPSKNKKSGSREPKGKKTDSQKNVGDPKFMNPTAKKKKLTPEEETFRPAEPTVLKGIFIKSMTLDKIETETNLQELMEREYKPTHEENLWEKIQSLKQEDDEGKVEYKWKLINPSHDRIDHLTTQMKFRLQEGNGEAIYFIGVEDNGNPIGLPREDMTETLRVICTMAKFLKADVILLKMRQGWKGKVAELMVRRNQKEGIKLDIRIMLLGCPGSGKSTLLGVLTSGKHDDGKGSARLNILSHKHEVLSGQTSSISRHIVGFDSEGKITNHKSTFGNPTWYEIVDQSTKILTFIDIGTNEKFAVSGISSYYPAYSLLVTSAKTNLTSAFESHLHLALVTQVPFIVVITQEDCASEDEKEQSIMRIREALKSDISRNMIPIVIQSKEDVVLISRTINKEKLVPIFLVSNVTGKNMDLFRTFLNLLPVTNDFSQHEKDLTKFLINHKFESAGKIILAGTVIKGFVKKHQILLLGPDDKGVFRQVEIINIECQRISVTSASCGQSCTIAIRPGQQAENWLQKNNNPIRKGMVLVDTKSNPKASWEFLAEIWVYGSSDQSEKILTSHYQPVINTLSSRQACTIVTELESDLKEGGDFGPLQLKKVKSKSIDHKNKTNVNNLVIPQTGNIQNMKKLPIHKLSCDNLALVTEKCFNKPLPNFDLAPEKVPFFAEADDLDPSKKSEVAELESVQQQKRQSMRKPKSGQRNGKPKGTQYIIYPDKKNFIRLRFKYYPEYICEGQQLLITDTFMKAIGWIKKIYY